MKAHRFWRFVRLRLEAYWRRERGEGPPYSPDPAIARYHFCNVHREADRGTRWLADRVACGADPLWSALVYRAVNRVATFEAWGSLPLRAMVPVPGEGEEWLRFLRDRMRSGEKVFTGRHCVGHFQKYVRAVRRLERGGLGLLAAELRVMDDVVHVWEAVQTLPYYGGFFAWQVTCDLIERGAASRSVVASADDWAHLGPGARAGARVVDADGDPLDTALRLRDRQPADLPPGPPEAPGPLSLKNIEHALCEYARWDRASDPDRAAGLEVRGWAR